MRCFQFYGKNDDETVSAIFIYRSTFQKALQSQNNVESRIYPKIFLGSPMFLTSERLSVVEYISSPTPTRSKFVFQQPKLSYENNLFLLSFEYYLWVGSGVLLLLIYLVLCIVAFWEWRRRNHSVSFQYFFSLIQFFSFKYPLQALLL